MKKFFFIFLSIAFLFPYHLFAAEIFYDADTRKVKANTEFEVGVFLSAESENINAVEGILRFPADILEFKELNDGNSIVNFWVERPSRRVENEITVANTDVATSNKQQETRRVFTPCLLRLVSCSLFHMRPFHPKINNRISVI